MHTASDQRQTGHDRDGNGGPAKPRAEHSDIAKLIAKLDQNSDQDVPGYRKGTGAGLTEHGVKTREVCSWLQVPAILQELQLASSNGKQVDIRLLFPDVGDKGTQAEIKKFFQSYHSKTAGEMYAELEQKLTAMQTAKAIQGFEAKAFLAEFSNLSRDNRSVLKVTDVIDINSKSSDPKSLIATLTEAAQVANGRKIALVVELPSTQAEALAAAIGSLKQSGLELKDVRVWVGSLNPGTSNAPAKKLEELTLDEFLTRVTPKKDKDGEGKDDSGSGSPPPLPPLTPNGASNLNGGPDNNPQRNDPPNGGAAVNGQAVGAPLSIPGVLKGLEETEQNLIASAHGTYNKPGQEAELAKQIAEIQATYGVLKSNMQTILGESKAVASQPVANLDLSASEDKSYS